MTESTGRGGDSSRLEQLVTKLSGAGRARHPEDLREFWRLYRGATSRLAALQADGRADQEEYYLNRLVGAAHAILYRSRSGEGALRRFLSFLATGWPALVRENRGFVGLATGIFAAGNVLGAFYSRFDPGFPGLVAPPDLLASIERGEMWTSGLLSLQPAASSLIFSNNVTVTILAFALGMTAGVGTTWLLLVNGVSFGALAYAVAEAGMGTAFWGFVAAHGVLELPAIFIAGAAGLRLGRGMLMPGGRTRRRSIAAASGEAVKLLAGCAPILLVAAAIETWFSPVPYPLGAKLAVAGALAASLAAYLARGRIR